MAALLSYLNRVLAAIVLFLVLRAFYRVTIHPLAKFPGPRLAGVTSAYQAWFDLRPSTSYIKEFPAYHKKYGPIVRITPNQLHIYDLNAYNESSIPQLLNACNLLIRCRIFRIGSRFSKDRANYNSEGVQGFFSVLDSKAVKPWRDPYQPFFSKAAISRLEPLIHDRIKQFLSGMESLVAASKPVDLSMGYRSLTSDVVTSYIFGDKGFELLQAEDFHSAILEALEQFFNMAQYTLYFYNFFAWFTRQAQKLTKEQAHMLSPALTASNWITEQCRIKVRNIMDAKGSTSSFPTVFDTWAKPDKDRKFTPSLRQLTADAFTFHGAGSDTTAHTLTMGTWYLINDEICLGKLRDELCKAISDPSSEMLVSGSILENLPYLRAVVKESLRLSISIPGRLARIAPEGGAVLCGRQIPAGTSVSSVHYVYHMDPTHFPEPETFRPERWLGPDSAQLCCAQHQLKYTNLRIAAVTRPIHNKLENKMVPFSRGPRSCIGINLAYAELYLTFAYVFRKFQLKAYKTDKESMEWKDNFVVTTKEHLRVTLTRMEE